MGLQAFAGPRDFSVRFADGPSQTDVSRTCGDALVRTGRRDFETMAQI